MGESETNAGRYSSEVQTLMLTERGKQQAQFYRERCAKLPIEVIYFKYLSAGQRYAQAVVELERETDRIFRPFHRT